MPTAWHHDWLIDAAFTIDLWNRSSTVSIAHKTYVKPTKRIFYSIMITMITQYTILLYIYMRYDIVYSYTVYTIYIYISYINVQYMYTIYMYYMNHDMMYNILHNIQYNIHALKIICCVGHHCRATVPRWRVLPAVFGHGAWIEWDPDSNAVMFM